MNNLNLNEALAPIVEKIKKFRPLYEQNEMAVRDLNSKSHFEESGMES